MNTSASIRVYDALLRCYPRAFRQEYGGDMSRMFAEQLRDEPFARIWLRCTVDLALTFPAQHLERHMNSPSPTAVPVLFTSLSAGGLLLTIVGGTNPGTRTIGLLAFALFLALAYLAQRHARPVGSDITENSLRWKLLGAGAGSLAAIAVVTSFTGAVPEPFWLPLMISIGVATILLAAGVVLAISNVAAAGRSKGTN